MYLLSYFHVVLALIKRIQNDGGQSRAPITTMVTMATVVTRAAIEVAGTARDGFTGELTKLRVTNITRKP